jgi:hypothetical protein
LGNGAYVGWSKGGRLASVGEEDGARRDEFFGDLEFGLKAAGESLWICRAMRDFHIISFQSGRHPYDRNNYYLKSLLVGKRNAATVSK